MNKAEWVTLERDCDALLIPSATPVNLPVGSCVQVMQTLGGAFTVNISGNLARIEGKDADALGKEPPAEAKKVAKIQTGPIGPVDSDAIWSQLKMCYDPEIPVNIVDLGLIYSVDIMPLPKASGNRVKVQMTLTAAGCNMGPVLANDVESKVGAVDNVTEVEIDLTFDPPWDREMMSEAAKLELGML